MDSEKINPYLSDPAYRFRRTEAAETFAKFLAQDVEKRPQVYSQKPIVLSGEYSPLECCLGSLRSQFQRRGLTSGIQRGSEATNGGIRFNLDDFVAGYVEALVEGKDIQAYAASYFEANFPNPVEAA